jgi:dihydropteroate synthase
MTANDTFDPGVVPARPDLGGGATTPSFRVPAGAGDGLPARPAPIAIDGREFRWGERTYVMGILNVTPDSFSGDGLLAADDAVAAGVGQARRMASEGADLLDIGGESTRPGHATVGDAEEMERVVPLIRAVRAALPAVPISIDTTKPAVAEAAIDAGAGLINDVWGVATDDALLRVAAERAVPIVLMHNRAEARYVNLVPEVLADLQAAIERALRAGVAWDAILVDPGFGFGKTAEHNLALLGAIGELVDTGLPVVVGLSRKATMGKLSAASDRRVGLAVDTTTVGPLDRLEASLAAATWAMQHGVAVVRAHDVRPHVHAAAVVAGAIERTPTMASSGA